MLIDLDAVDRVLSRRAGHVEEDFSIGQGCVGIDFVTHHDLSLRIPVADVEISFIRRERDSIGAFQIGAHQLQLGLIEGKHAAVGKPFTRVVVGFRQTERRIAKEERSVGAIDEIIGTVEPLAFVAVGQAQFALTVVLPVAELAFVVAAVGTPEIAPAGQAAVPPAGAPARRRRWR